MLRTIKYLFYAIIALVALSVTTLLSLSWLPGYLTSLVQMLAIRYVSPELSIQSASIDYYPHIELRLKNIGLADKQAFLPVRGITVAGLIVSGDYLDLIRNRLGGISLEIIDPALDLMSVGAASNAHPEQVSSCSIPRLPIKAIKIRKGNIKLESDGHSHSAENISLELKGKSPAINSAGAFHIFNRAISYKSQITRPHPNQEQVQLTVESDGGKLTINSTLKSSANGCRTVSDFTLSLPSLRMLSILDENLPDIALENFSGKVTSDHDTISLTKLALQLGDSDLAGDLKIDLSKPEPQFNGSLTSNRLDFNPFASKEPTTTSENLFSKEPLGLNSLLHKSIDLKVHFKSLIVDRETTLENVSLSLLSTNDDTTLSIENIDIHQGKIQGTLLLSANEQTPQLTTKLLASDVALDTLLRVGSALKGKGSVKLDLSGSGDSMHDLIASASGSLTILSNGGILEPGISRFLSASPTRFAQQILLDDSEDPYYCWVSSFIVDEGSLRTEAQLLYTPEFSLTGRGTIDLIKETLDLKITSQSHTPNLSSLLVPLIIDGKLTAPNISPDMRSLALELGSAPLTLAQGGLSQTFSLLGSLIRSPNNKERHNVCQKLLDQTLETEQIP